MFLGPKSAELISSWLVKNQISIAVLDLKQNQLGDEGLLKLAPAIRVSEVVSLDLSQNGLTRECAQALYQMLRLTESIVHLEIGSTLGSFQNRLGREVWLQFSKIFYQKPQPLLQILNISGVSLSSQDLQTFANAIVQSNYCFLEQLDISNNRIQGVSGGQAIATLLNHYVKPGIPLQTLTVKQNKLENEGAALVFEALLHP
jgi:Ran GTPase-activating protein (RanGAP) involved in mRNA processing and transport